MTKFSPNSSLWLRQCSLWGTIGAKINNVENGHFVSFVILAVYEMIKRITTSCSVTWRTHRLFLPTANIPLTVRPIPSSPPPKKTEKCKHVALPCFPRVPSTQVGSARNASEFHLGCVPCRMSGDVRPNVTTGWVCVFCFEVSKFLVQPWTWRQIPGRNLALGTSNSCRAFPHTSLTNRCAVRYSTSRRTEGAVHFFTPPFT